MDIPSALLPTRYGKFELQIFLSDGIEHIVLIKGILADNCLVRLHSECATGDILGSLRCDCRDQLEESLDIIERAGSGLLVYMRGQEGRGIGLSNKIRAYALQEQGMDTYEANVHLGFAPDARNYAVAVNILKHFNLKKVRLLTNNPDKIEALEEGGIEVTENVPLWTATNPYNERYIASKKARMEKR
ncbi:MAG: GTP cyclohydrolase II [Alphaproteobacteria bacterium]|nr:GTP cyclohydrolase II [Alphaproteobacteria bacterium]